MTDLVSRIPPLLIAPALTGMAAIAAWPWALPALQVAAGTCVLLAIVADGISLSMLPRRKRSFGPVTPPLVALALLRSAVSFVLGVLWPSWPVLIGSCAIQLAITAAQLYATWIEPFHLTLTELELASPKLKGETPIRALQVSDLHFEGWTPRERQVIQAARDLAPDLVLLTGDYLNLSTVRDRASQEGIRELLASLAALAPTYAITGSPPVDRPGVIPEILAGLPITWLVNDRVELEISGQRIQLAGLRCTRNREIDAPQLQLLLADHTGDPYTILLYHSPDLMPEAVERGVDLYLAGHTHGGQIRLPLFGALITSSDFGKRYEGGLYREGPTALYVCRGLGLEGLGAPRARFLAPPELVLLTIGAGQPQIKEKT
jgi:predicted MPP superfamily phosphohydrolase